ncbi:MAG: NAD-dependent epimerase/dehydratase family protein [Candidatus Rokubacteria bacterium]|nr:NAD-dependent epimerase/dehydratase family protein [Candidatus Rokubacteria bacterium]
MDVLVTGATGFVGANLVRALLADGYRVRVLVRPTSTRKALTGCPVEVVYGDLVEPDSLGRPVAGCRLVFHVAADYRLWAPDPSVLYRTNVEGTRSVLEACARAGVERVVYTSSCGTLGIPKDGRPGTEATPVSLQDMIGDYKRSKFLAERAAEEYAARGLPIVIVNPTNPIGPWDVKPTPTGQMVLDFLKGRMFGTLDTGLNLVHAADVARGHILAARKGRVGEKYILGNRNYSLTEIFELLAQITGLPAPRFRVPYALIWLVALAMEGMARVTGKPPRVPLTGVRMARKHMYFSTEKAVRELGLPQTPVELALRDAVAWFVEHGYVSPPPAYRKNVNDRAAVAR